MPRPASQRRAENAAAAVDALPAPPASSRDPSPDLNDLGECGGLRTWASDDILPPDIPRGIRPEPPASGAGFPTSYNRAFDEIILQLIREHRRVVTEGLEARERGPSLLAKSDALEVNRALSASTARSDRTEEAEYKRDTNFLRDAGDEDVERLVLPSVVSAQFSGMRVASSSSKRSSDLRDLAREESKPIRLRLSETGYLDMCQRVVEVERVFSQARMANKAAAVREGIHGFVSRYVKKVVRHEAFEPFFAALIMLNAAIVGIEINQAAETLDYEPIASLVAIQTACNIAFLVEWLLRLLLEGLSFFWRSPDVFWNWFDTVTVLFSVVAELAVTMSEGAIESKWSPSSLRVAKTVRIMRVLRVARASRLFSFVHAFRVLIFSILSTMHSLAWAMLLLLGIFYLFSTLLTQAATELRIESSDQAMVDAATKFWGSLTRAMLTLFMSISGGVSWIEPVEPLEVAGLQWVVVFGIFIAFTYLAALNVVTAVFCEKAHQSASEDQHNMIRQLRGARLDLVKKMKKIFKTCDRDESGVITLAEFERHLDDDEVRICFESLGIEINDALELFRLLDADHGGGVDLAELVVGAMKVKGNAKGIDVVQVKHDVQMLRHDVREVAMAVGRLLHTETEPALLRSGREEKNEEEGLAACGAGVPAQ